MYTTLMLLRSSAVLAVMTLASVAHAASVSPDAAVFPPYPATVLHAVADIAANVSGEYTIAINVGAGAGATASVRRMTRVGGTETLEYTVYRDAGRTVVWGEGGSAHSGTGAGLVNLTAYLSIPGGQFVAPGMYTDALLVTATDGASSSSEVMVVTVEVPPPPGLSTQAAFFPPYTASVLHANAEVSVNVTSDFTIAIDAGEGAGATDDVRRMTRVGGTETLDYRVFRDVARTVVWGEGASAFSGTGSGLNNVTAYLLIPGGQYVTPGTYTDALLVTVTEGEYSSSEMMEVSTPVEAVAHEVTTLADGVDAEGCEAAADGNCTLREAMEASAAEPTADVITFAVSGTILLSSALPTITASAGALEIDGGGQKVVIDGDGAARPLDVSGISFTLTDVTLQGGLGALRLGAGSTASISRVAFLDNHATSGGAIDFSGSALTVSNSTFWANSAVNEGGAIVSGGGTVVLDACTFASNAASLGGALYVPGAVPSLTLRNSLLAGNDGSPTSGNCGGAMIDGGGNLEDENTCNFTTSLANAIAMLDPEGAKDHGGASATIALLDGSDALDAITGGGCTGVDQRGVARPQGEACDIGAYEAQLVTLTAARAGSGSGSVVASGIACGADCSEAYAQGSPITFTATPASSSDFAGFSANCIATGPATCVASADVAKTVTATFDLKPRTLTIEIDGPGIGIVTTRGVHCGSECDVTELDGAVVTLTATPAQNAFFVGFSEPCVRTGALTCEVTLDADKTVTAEFEIEPRALTIVKVGSGRGIVTGEGIDCGPDCDSTVSDGTSITLSAAALAGSTFVGWATVCSGMGPCDVTLDADMAVVAIFDRTRTLDPVPDAGIPDAGGNPDAGGVPDAGDDPDAGDPASDGIATFSAALDFGEVLLGTASGAHVLAIHNTGNAALSVTRTSLSDAQDDFSVDVGDCMDVAPAASCEIEIVFTPSAVGEREATLTVTTDTSASPHRFSLTGFGIEKGAGSGCGCSALGSSGAHGELAWLAIGLFGAAVVRARRPRKVGRT